MNDKYNKELHVVSFDVPFPPDYGGVIDVFFKIRALTKLGFRITLHCWHYGRELASKELESICENVIYYKRNRFKNPFSGPMPYIVKTRVSDELVKNLRKNQAPVLFEGLHTTAPLFFDELKGRTVVVRNHNIESDYYRLLAEKEGGSFKKTYFKQEAKSLKSYEDVLARADYVASISIKDHEALSKRFNSVYVPAFHPNEEVSAGGNYEDYCLYHGNLAVGENNEAALFLASEVFPKLPYKLIIAGNKASAQLKEVCADRENIEIRENLMVEEFDELISHAKINVLPTFQNTGIKLKLINALYKGGHCVVNDEMVKDSGLEPLCVIANGANEFVQEIKKVYSKSFQNGSIEKRKQLLESSFSNEHSAKVLAKLF